jgi:hypothetical protein
MGVVRQVGKQGNAYLYQFAVPPNEKKGKKGKGRRGKRSLRTSV